MLGLNKINEYNWLFHVMVDISSSIHMFLRTASAYMILSSRFCSVSSLFLFVSSFPNLWFSTGVCEYYSRFESQKLNHFRFQVGLDVNLIHQIETSKLLVFTRWKITKLCSNCKLCKRCGIVQHPLTVIWTQSYLPSPHHPLHIFNNNTMMKCILYFHE